MELQYQTDMPNLNCDRGENYFIQSVEQRMNKKLKKAIEVMRKKYLT